MVTTTTEGLFGYAKPGPWYAPYHEDWRLRHPGAWAAGELETGHFRAGNLRCSSNHDGTVYRPGHTAVERSVTSPTARPRVWRAFGLAPHKQKSWKLVRGIGRCGLEGG